VRDIAVLLAAATSLFGLWHWHHWYLPYLILAAVGVLERPEPEPETARPLAVASLKQWQVGWGRATRPVSRPSTRAQAAYS
jgi:hypothetical protein